MGEGSSLPLSISAGADDGGLEVSSTEASGAGPADGIPLCAMGDFMRSISLSVLVRFKDGSCEEPEGEG